MKKHLKKSLAFLAAVVMTFSSVLPNLTAYAASSITYNKTIQDSHGTKTSIFQVDGIYAWCCEAEKPTPARGQAVTIAESTNENLRKVLWYGCKGPGAILSDNNDGYMQTSQAASLALGNGTVNSRYRAWYNNVVTKAAPPSGFKAYVATPTNASLQKLAYFVYTPAGSAYLQKSSSNAGFSSGSGYSLSGATYGVYTDSACTNKIETFTTNASGTSNTITVNAGTYYVKETSAPAGFVLDTTVYTLTVVSGETAVLNVSDAPKGRLKLQKTSALPEITDGNNCYSLAGAVYGVYTDSACTNEVGRLTTDANGVTNEIILDTNTYYVKELVAPNGYLLDNVVKNTSISAGQVTTLQVKDQPGNDPIAIEITKIAPNGATHVPSLAGTQFTVKYYDGLYTKDNLPSIATRTWVIETKETLYNNTKHYLTRLHDDYKVSGDAFYKISGQIIVPIGTISIEETKPAPGYTLANGFLQEKNSSTKHTGIYVTQVKEDGSGAISLVGGNEFQGTNYLLYGGVEVQKYDSQTNTAQGAASLAGAKFTIKNANDYAVTVNGTSYNKGDVITTLTTDKNGYAATAKNLLPYGKYEVEEIEAPEGHQLSGTNLKQTVTVTEENTLVTAVTYDDVIRGGLEIHKVDKDMESDKAQAGASLKDAEFAIINKNTFPVYVNGKTYAKDEVVMTVKTNENGIAKTASNTLPYGTYEVVETKASEGYKVSGENLKQTVVIKNNTEIVTLKPVKEEIIRGDVAIQKHDSQTGAVTQGSATLKGAEFTVKSLNANDLVVDGKTYKKGDVITTLVTNESGYAKTSLGLPYGKYEIEETKAPAGYLLSGTNLKQQFEIKEDGKLVELNSEGTIVKDNIIRGGLELHKVDFDTEKDQAQAGASLKDAEFAIVNKNERPVVVNGKSYAKNETVMTIKTDDEGVAKTASNVLPYGTYEVVETKASEGYKVSGENLKQTVVIKNNAEIVTLKPVKEEIIRGDVAIQKHDSQTGAIPQGSATLKGAEFTVKSLNANDLVVNGKTYKKGDVITTLVTDETGYAKTSLGLPYGKYEIEETKSPAGYLLSGTNLKQQFEIKEDGKLVELNSEETVVKDNVIRGGLEIHKVDLDTEKDHAQAGASLKDAKFAIVNKNENPVIVNGVAYEKGKIVMTISTDDNGVAKTAANVLPYGTYEVYETKASEGYKVSGENLKQTVVIKNNTEIVTLKPVKEEIIRGDVAIQKHDSQTDEAFAQGSATLKGAEFTVKSLNANDLVVDGKTYKKGDVIATIVTNEKGYAETRVGLPYGKYEIEEVKVPEGFLLAGTNLKQQFEIKEDGKLVKLTGENEVVKDNVIRGDFELRKIEHYSKEAMANVEFKITSKTTGESHVIVTDENGYYSSSAEYILHSDEKGLWFGLDSEGNNVDVNDKLGALPYDTYEIEELRCDANMHTDLYKGEFTISENNKVVDLGVIENYARSIKTSAKDSETETNYATPDEEVVIIDTVYYEGLFVGEEYRLEGVLMDKVTGKAFLDKDGKEITASTVFKPEEREGYVDVTFKFDATLLAGKIAVVFETLFDAEGNIQAEHKDIDDTKQTVYFPEIKTSLKDNDGYQSIFAGPVKLIDTITYKGLEAGKEYTVEGTLKDKETGKSILDEEKNEIKATTTFVAKESDGTVDVVFKFDATLLAGKTLVAFEKLFFDGKEYAVHEDINDVAQTVYVPKVSTSAHDKKDNDKNVVIGGVATIVDKISYENLTVGETYVVKGVLMDKNTGKPVLVDGKEITATKEFVAETADGFVEIEFSIDTDKLGAKTLVVFEEVYQLIEKEAEVPETPDTEGTLPEEPEKKQEERLIAEHKDITDKHQTVTFTETPKTGDMNVILPWIAVMGLAAAMIAFVMKKRLAR